MAGFMVRVVSTSDNGTSGDTTDDPDAINSNEVDVAAIDPSANGVKARRQAAAADTTATASGNFIQASWTAMTSDASDFRLVAQVASTAYGATVWVVLAGPTSGTGTERALVSAEIDDAYSTALPLAPPSGAPSTETVTVTAAELRAAIQIAVESVQGDPSATNMWKRSAEVDLAARAGS